MRMCLYWNHTAGGGLSLERLTSVIEGAGHSVVRAIDDESDLPSNLGDAECVVVAGGDGTVARAGRVLAGGPVPLAMLPVGTANNIASSLDIHGDLEQLAARWHEGQVVKIDVGVVEAHGSAHRFLESVGCGLVTSCIVEGEATLAKDHPETHLSEARDLYLETLRHHAPRHYDITLDDERISGEFLVVEVLNVPSIGPKIELTADVSAADGVLSVVLLKESDRNALVAYLAARGSGPAAPAGFRSWRVKTIEIAGADRFHVDDRVMDSGGNSFSIGIHSRSLAILA
jgi:diacylglycerol kinase family enzyme